ncbi:MAG: NUDIX hydrolase [Pseudomonadota bacterium]|nr:NUDIX hydrolase [Pseudomonadota bacterium]
MKLPDILIKPALWLYTWGDQRDEVSGLIRQTGALPWRLTGSSTEVLLITGRNSGRWMIPKGWPMRGKSLAEAAAQEAFEEAGVRGTIEAAPIGTVRHVKRHLLVGPLEISILVHALAVESELPIWPEQAQRKRKWFGFEQAASLVRSSELSKLILKLPESN